MKQISLRLEEEIFNEVVVSAKENKRSINSELAFTLGQYYKDTKNSEKIKAASLYAAHVSCI